MRGFGVRLKGVMVLGPGFMGGFQTSLGVYCWVSCLRNLSGFRAPGSGISAFEASVQSFRVHRFELRRYSLEWSGV